MKIDVRYSKYFQRGFSKFMDMLYSKQLLEKPTIQNCDIESFFIHVTELKARVEELEKEIAIHAFNNRHGNLHPNNAELLARCRIKESEAYGLYDEYCKDRQRYESERLGKMITF